MARASATPSISFTGPGAGPDRGPLAAETFPDERTADVALRPKRFDEYVGQRAVLDKLKVYVQAAKKRQEPLDHALFCGPPGLGKTSLAHLIAQELGVEIHVTSGPAVERKGDLAGILTNLARGQILFIDEIHRLAAPIEETLYPAMEDFQLDVVFETGPAARTLKLPLERFTLIGATTRGGLLTSPLRDRFQIVERLDYYTPEDLASIAVRSAGLLGIPLDQSGAKEIGRRSRGTPRIANRLLRRIRDFAEVQGTGHIDQRAADSALRQLEIDALGLDVMDRRILVTIMDNFDGGPVGLETIAASVGEERDTLEDVYEPFLIQQGLLQRTPRGRVATARAYEHLGRQTPRVDPREISSKMTEAAQALFARDFFFEVMKDSQRLRAGYLAERERWLRNLAVDGREEVLFEFEMLLRALERYFNVHNLPLEPRSDMLNRDFTEELAAVREAVARAVQLTQLLLDPPSNRNLVFRKFLETQLADDRTRGKLLEQQLSQETPQESLFLLRGGFVALRGVLDSLLKLPHQSYQTFQDVGQLIVREVALNKYFRPFRPLEFRPEYDRIKSVRILEILRKPLETVAQNEKVRRPVSLAFLGFFRLLHYLRYVPVGRDETHRRGYLTLALVRSETASLAVFLEGEVAAALVDVGSRPASGVTRIALELRKETTKVYGRFMSDVSPGDQVAAGRVREALESHFKQWITSLAQLFQPEIDGKELFDDYVSRKEQARRLRQDLWAFREVCKLCDRAAQRGTATDMEDALRRLRRFLAYFQDVSYQLLRYGDYGPFDRFVQIVSEADVTKLAQPRTRRQFRDDCRAFGEVVAQTFEAVSKREELSGQPFIEAEAARVLEEIAA